jgi:hypothetical protein
MRRSTFDRRVLGEPFLVMVRALQRRAPCHLVPRKRSGMNIRVAARDYTTNQMR